MRIRYNKFVEFLKEPTMRLKAKIVTLITLIIFTLSFQAPRGTAGEVRLPVPQNAQIVLDGVPVEENAHRTDTGPALAALGGARHRLDAFWPCDTAQSPPQADRGEP